MFSAKKHIAPAATANNAVTIAETTNGHVAVRDLGATTFCVHVTPASEESNAAMAKLLTRNIFVDPSWTQPEAGRSYYETTTHGPQALHEAVEMAVRALEDGTANDWETALMALTGPTQ